MKARVVLGAAIVAASAVACQLLIGLEDPQESPPDSGVPPVDLCNPVVPPERPDATDNPNESKQLGFAALHHIYFAADGDGGAPEGGSQGYNLDGTCTCSPRGLRTGSSCAAANPGTDCDFNGGVDNSLVRVSFKYAAAGIKLDDALLVNKRIATGVATLILHLSNYNGKLDDPAVGFGFADAFGSEYPYDHPDDPFCAAQDAGPRDAAAPRDAGPRDGGDAGDAEPVYRTPIWNGCDAWQVSQQRTIFEPSERAGFIPTLRIDSAYVRDGKLVARGTVPLNLRLGLFNLPINDLVVTADVVLLDQNSQPVPFGSDRAFRYRLANGIFAGRIRAQDLSFVLGGIPRGPGAPPICDPRDPLSALLFKTVKDEVCAGRDIAQIPKFDNQSPLVACDALSVALPFDADPAYMGNRVPDTAFPPVMGGCDSLLDAGSDAAPVIADAAGYFSCP